MISYHMLVVYVLNPSGLRKVTRPQGKAALNRSHPACERSPVSFYTMETVYGSTCSKTVVQYIKDLVNLVPMCAKTTRSPKNASNLATTTACCRSAGSVLDYQNTTIFLMQSTNRYHLYFMCTPNLILPLASNQHGKSWKRRIQTT